MDSTVVLHDASTKRWLRFQNPVEVITAHRVEDVRPAVQRIEAAVNRERVFAAGFLSYEAAPAFDPALTARPATSFPLLWFGLYSQPETITLPPVSARQGASRVWTPDVSRTEYEQAFDRIKQYLSTGDIYQVNYTFRLGTPFAGDAWELFLELATAQQADYGAFVDTGRFALCSASPELFFELDGTHLTSKPMKGTAARGCLLGEDLACAETLRLSEKNRAENIMIVDMIRNDMGRVAQIGSVRVPCLFDIERYPTVWQMTSTVTAQTLAPVAEVIRALFPCASITGAPKARSMRVIQHLEPTPRRIYTGSIGYIAPDRQAQFNVAIRTVLVDRETGQAEYGVGGGIVWDSTLGDEYEECLTKARVLTAQRKEFQLFETLLWTPEAGYFLLFRHLHRLRESAAYFGFTFDENQITHGLNALATDFSSASHRVKCSLSQNGSISFQSSVLPGEPEENPVRLGLAPTPVTTTNHFLYHKTTRRDVYETARSGRSDCDDVALWNERGEITESTIANLVVRIGGELVTPPVISGLLGGTFRAWLLEQREIRERVITVEEFKESREIYLVNSVRKWRKAVLR